MPSEGKLDQVCTAATHGCNNEQEQHNLECSELRDTHCGLPRLTRRGCDLKDCSRSCSDKAQGEPRGCRQGIEQSSGCGNHQTNGDANENPPQGGEDRC
jgi:hypothetical protein